MKAAAAIFGPAAIIIALVFVPSTDWYQQLVHPKRYWGERVARYTELVATYTADLQRCRTALERLRLSSSRDIWIKQKLLEGLTAGDAAKDYQIGLDAQKAGCDFAEYAVPAAVADLEKARAKLQAAR